MLLVESSVLLAVVQATMHGLTLLFGYLLFLTPLSLKSIKFHHTEPLD